MNDVTKKRVLLVGGNPSVFLGCQTHLAGGDGRWEIVTSPDEPQALATLAATPTDAVVVDSALADVDTFFGKLRTLYPGMALLCVRDRRLPQSLCPKTASVIQILPSYGGEQLVAMIDRALNLAVTLASPRVRNAVGKLEALPTVPQTYHAMTAAASNPDASIADIAKIISTDPLMTIKILQIVNSAYFGRAQKTSSITQAVSFLGVEQLKSLVLSAHVFGALETTKIRGFSLDQFQKYSIHIARTAQRFVVDRTLAEDAFTTGMVHDIGKVVFALQKSTEFEQINDQLPEVDTAAYVLESEIIGASHAEAGAYLLSTWGIPWPIVESVAFHHTPSLVSTVAGGCEILAAIHAADALTGIILCGEPEDRLDLGFIERAGMLGELPRWRKLIQDEHEGL